MTLSELKDFAFLAQFLATLGVGFVVLWAKVNFTPRADHKAAIDKIDARDVELARRITAVETVASQCATRDQLAALQADYRELNARLEAVDQRLDESLPQIRTQLNRMEDYLLKAAK